MDHAVCRSAATSTRRPFRAGATLSVRRVQPWEEGGLCLEQILFCCNTPNQHHLNTRKRPDDQAVPPLRGPSKNPASVRKQSELHKGIPRHPLRAKRVVGIPPHGQRKPSVGRSTDRRRNQFKPEEKASSLFQQLVGTAFLDLSGGGGGGGDGGACDPPSGPRTLKVVPPGDPVYVNHLARKEQPGNGLALHRAHVERGERDASAGDEFLFERPLADDLSGGGRDDVAYVIEEECGRKRGEKEGETSGRLPGARGLIFRHVLVGGDTSRR